MDNSAATITISRIRMGHGHGSRLDTSGLKFIQPLLVFNNGRKQDQQGSQDYVGKE
jgi:hypothetical protein